jgi:hypothetical protein
MKKLRTSIGLSLVMVCLIASSCDQAKQVGKTLGSLAQVRGEIIKKFGEDGVDVRVNSAGSYTTISITFINSALNNKPDAEREKRAQETAEIVKTTYSDIKSVKQILVSFMRAQTKFLVFHWNVVFDFHAFDNEAKPLDNRPGVEPIEHLRPSVVYSPTKNQTDVSVGGLQLEGVAGNGLTMLPRLTLPGDTSKATPRAPANVTLDFASFAEKQSFPGVTKIELIGDDKIVFQTEGQFSTSRSNDGLVSEFLYLTIPYSKFQKLVASKEFSLKLGEKKYDLTDEQLQAVRSMTTYVK